MKIIAELRALKSKVIELQQNQKEKEVKGPFTCSGSPVTERDPVQVLSMLEMEVESLYEKLIDAQQKAIKAYENNY